MRFESSKICFFGLLLGNVSPILYKAVSYANIHAKYSSYMFVDIFMMSAISPTFQNNMADFFSCFLEFMPQFDIQNVALLLCWIYIFIKLTNGCFRWSRYAVMLHKPFLTLDYICFRQNVMVIHNMKFSSVHSFYKGKSSVTYTTAICNEIGEISCKFYTNLLRDDSF